MGCSNSDASDPVAKLALDTGADEIKRAPNHGANELPPEPYEPEFPADHFIAWIIDDAVAKTKPLPKWKKVVDLPENPMNAAMDYSMSDDEAAATDRSAGGNQPPQQHPKLPKIPDKVPNRDQTSRWVSELRDILVDDFSFGHITTSIYATVSELVDTQSLLCRRLEKCA